MQTIDVGDILAALQSLLGARWPHDLSMTRTMSLSQLTRRLARPKSNASDMGSYKEANRRGQMLRQSSHQIPGALYSCLANMSRGKGSQPAVSELPPCEGPKLNVFQHYKSRIQWLERLDNEDEDVTSSQGYVFRALIRGHEYAVKVVCNNTSLSYYPIFPRFVDHLTYLRFGISSSSSIQ